MSAPVLLALGESTASESCLTRAVSIAGAFGAELHVLRVIPDALLAATLPRLNALHAARSLQQRRCAQQKTCTWLKHQLGAEAPLQNVSVTQGDFVERVSAHAIALNASLIVVPPLDWQLGTIVTSLARAAQRPVLVARASLPCSTILAATDLGDSNYSVLDRAAELGSTLRAKVVTFHNSDPLPAALNGAVAAPGPDAPGANPLQRLQAASSRMLPPGTAVVRSEIDPVWAILEEARLRKADLVVVGTHDYRPWWERVLHGSVASRVVRRAVQSVLVTPITVARSELGASC